MRGSYPYTVYSNADGMIEIVFPQFPEEVLLLEPSNDNETISKAAFEMLIEIFEARMARREAIPSGEGLKSENGGAFVFVSYVILAKIILYNSFCHAGISYNAFAKKIGITQTDLSRLLNLRHESRGKTILSVFEALRIKIDWDISTVPIEYSYPT